MFNMDSLQTYFLLNTSSKANKNEDTRMIHGLTSKTMLCGLRTMQIPKKPIKVVSQRIALTFSFKSSLDKMSVKKGME